MTKDKARKRAIRARMAKTGERYGAARRHVVKAPKNVADPGMSDAAVRRGSGRGWDEWFRILDAWNATGRTHRAIARHLSDEHGVTGWWAQTMTVGYERARGLRAVHQTPRGFEVNISKTLPVSVDRLSSAFVNPRSRSRWLERGLLTLRTKTEGKSARFDFMDGATRVHVHFVARGPSKASVGVQHVMLPDAGAVEEMRAFWKERLGKLAQVLQP